MSVRQKTASNISRGGYTKKSRSLTRAAAEKKDWAVDLLVFNIAQSMPSCQSIPSSFGCMLYLDDRHVALENKIVWCSSFIRGAEFALRYGLPTFNVQVATIEQAIGLAHEIGLWVYVF